MKLISVLLAFSLSTASLAGVKEDVAALGKLAFCPEVTQSKGKIHEAIFKRWISITNGEAGPLVYKEVNDMAYGNEAD